MASSAPTTGAAARAGDAACPAERILVARPDNLDLPPAPPRTQAQAATREEEERNRIRMAKLQMLEEGVKARTGVAMVAPRSAASSTPPAGAPATRQEALAELADGAPADRGAGPRQSDLRLQARLQQLQVPGAAGAAADESRAAPTLLISQRSKRHLDVPRKSEPRLDFA